MKKEKLGCEQSEYLIFDKKLSDKGNCQRIQ